MFIKDLSAFAAAAHQDCAASSVKADQAADKAASQESHFYQLKLILAKKRKVNMYLKVSAPTMKEPLRYMLILRIGSIEEW